MDFGAHLPLMDFGGNRYTLADLCACTRTAAELGSRAVSVNDHMVFSVGKVRPHSSDPEQHCESSSAYR